MWRACGTVCTAVAVRIRKRKVIRERKNLINHALTDTQRRWCTQNLKNTTEEEERGWTERNRQRNNLREKQENEDGKIK